MPGKGGDMGRLEINSENELLEKLNTIGVTDDEQKKELICSLIGHSRIQTTCFGYYYCARCGTQVGDTLAGVYPGAVDTVIVGHNCPTCRENYKKLTWKDKVFSPDPFAENKI